MRRSVACTVLLFACGVAPSGQLPATVPDLASVTGDGSADPCSDGVLNGSETDLDCGGLCAACTDGRLCKAGADCATGQCDNGVCVSCHDGAHDGQETDVDCGGPLCRRCLPGFDCSYDSDCEQATCIQGVCRVPVALTFGAPIEMPLSSPVHDIALGDLNGDKRLDVVVGTAEGVLYLHGRGDGTLDAPSLTVPMPSAIRGLCTGDVDVDGLDDVLVADGSAIHLMLSATRRVTRIAWAGAPALVSVGHFDTGRYLDIVAAGRRLGIFTGDGQGAFYTPLESTMPDEVVAMAAQDMDGNGVADAVVALERGPAQVLLVQPDMTVRRGSPLYLERQPGEQIVYSGIAVGDFDGDGRPDVVITSTRGDIGLFFGDGRGNFNALTTWAQAAPDLRAIAVADFNLDGRDDVVVGGDAKTLEVYLSTRDGSTGLSRPISIALGERVVALRTGDLTRDGKPDIVAACGPARSHIAVIPTTAR